MVFTVRRTWRRTGKLDSRANLVGSGSSLSTFKMGSPASTAGTVSAVNPGSTVSAIRVAALALTGFLVAAATVPANAVPNAEAIPTEINGLATAEYIARYDHPLGSQIARVEGNPSSPTQAPDTTPGEPAPPAIPDTAQATVTVPGIDVSGHQKNVDWPHWWGQGKRFVYVKATESTTYRNPYFAQQYNGSYHIGMIRGAYHFATPDTSSGAAQAHHFVNHGGGWSADGKTLPGALDMEYNPYGATCYGKSKGDMTAWIKDFSDTYHARTGRYPMIYTSTNWWNQCVDGNFGHTNPLWIARYNSFIGPLPHSWSVHTMWQYSSTPIDQNSFNGPQEGLVKLATG